MKRALGFLILFSLTTSSFASQPLETETARPLKAGVIKLEAVAEYQTSNQGTERAFPFVVEYGITDRTEIAVEPVFGTSIRPKNGTAASGFGDIEVTLTHLLLPESGQAPAFAVAGEVKLPTARNRLIGTGKTDFTAWAIASKRIGRIDLHGNLGYTLVGKPAGTHLGNIINYALAEEFHLSPRVDIVGEILGNTSSSADTGSENSGGSGLPAEATLAESSVLVGARYHVTPSFFVAGGVSYDKNHAVLIRTGITYRFGTR